MRAYIKFTEQFMNTVRTEIIIRKPNETIYQTLFGITSGEISKPNIICRYKR